MTNTWHPMTIYDIRILSYFQINWVDPVILPLWCVKGNVDDVLPKSRFFLRQLYTIFDPEAEYNGAESGRGEIVILSLFSGETVRRCGRNKEWTGLQPLCRGKERNTSSLYWHWQETSSGYWPAHHTNLTPADCNGSFLQFSSKVTLKSFEPFSFYTSTSCSGQC